MDAERRDVVRSRVFGEVAEVYDAYRPGYPDALVDEVLAYAALGGRPAVEVGAGTGKAAAAFAARGVPLVCVEPDPRMAEVLARTTAPYPQVRVEVGAFEEWEPGGRRYGLLAAAACWHWLDRDRRWDLAHAALAPGGAVALFWNGRAVRDEGLRTALAEVDARHGVDRVPHSDPLSAWEDEQAAWAEGTGWPAEECRRDGRFTGLRSVRFREEHRYGTEHWVGYLSSISAYRMLPEDRRASALAGIAGVLDAHGGGIDVVGVSDLFLARAR
ncbi:class I SAM-dependent methyltransferase [Streptomyces sp. NPDC001380]|uniref:class I SAM-dependent methyltransferase n=1 Tax=Streptomyces sp. NPDC001380 TaxID=3364566 RepID=UPI0036C904DA